MKEKEIENAILKYLSYIPECFAWKNNTTGIYDPVKKVYRKNVNKFAITGVSDILGIYKEKFLAIEVKTKSGRVSEKQRLFLGMIELHGGYAGVARCLKDVKKILNIEEKLDENTTAKVSDRLSESNRRKV